MPEKSRPSAAPQVKSRPRIPMISSPLEKLLNAGTVVGLVALIGITVWGFFVAPAVIPTHFNALGKADGYGGKASLITLPIVGILFYALFGVLARYPHIYNFPWPITEENASRQYRLARTLLCWLNLLICWLFVIIQWGTVQAAFFHPVQGLIIGVLIGGIAIVVISIVFYLVIAARER